MRRHTIELMLATMLLASCGGNGTQSESVADSTSVTATDTAIISNEAKATENSDDEVSDHDIANDLAVKAARLIGPKLIIDEKGSPVKYNKIKRYIDEAEKRRKENNFDPYIAYFCGIDDDGSTDDKEASIMLFKKRDGSYIVLHDKHSSAPMFYEHYELDVYGFDGETLVPMDDIFMADERIASHKNEVVFNCKSHQKRHNTELVIFTGDSFAPTPNDIKITFVWDGEKFTEKK